MRIDLEEYGSSEKDCRDILMSQTFADLEFHAQDRDATRGKNAPNEGHATDGDGQRLEVSAEVVRQNPTHKVFANLGSGLEIQLRMNVLVKTSVHHRSQFATNLRRGMQRNNQEPFLQPAVEVFDGAVAPGLVLGDESQFDANQQS